MRIGKCHVLRVCLHALFPLLVGLSTDYAFAFPSFLSDDQQLSLPATGSIKFDRIRILSVRDGAPNDIFEKPNKFPRLSNVGLATSSENSRLLKSLAENYPQINALSVSQSKSLDDDFINRFSLFKQLKVLSLACPITSPSIFSKTVPKLRKLSLETEANLFAGTNILDLPNLQALDLRGCNLDKALAISIKAPRLRKIILVQVQLPISWSSGIEKFPNLRSIDMYRVSVSDETIAALKKRHIKLCINH